MTRIGINFIIITIFTMINSWLISDVFAFESHSGFPNDEVLLCEVIPPKSPSFFTYSKDESGKIIKYYTLIQTYKHQKRAKGTFYRFSRNIKSYSFEDDMIWFEEIWNEMDYKGTNGKKGLKIEGIKDDLSGFFFQTIDKGGWFTEDKIKIIERDFIKCSFVHKNQIKKEEHKLLQTMKEHYCSRRIINKNGKTGIDACN